MDKLENAAARATKGWVKPELKRLDAGSAENAPPGQLPDGNAGQQPPSRNEFIS